MIAAVTTTVTAAMMRILSRWSVRNAVKPCVSTTRSILIMSPALPAAPNSAVYAIAAMKTTRMIAAAAARVTIDPTHLPNLKKPSLMTAFYDLG